MSMTLDTKTPNKKEIAGILRAVATWIETSGNKTISINLRVTFSSRKEEAA